MSDNTNDNKLHELLRDLELPDQAYDLAKKRYVDVGAWVEEPSAPLAAYDPHVFVQGSFALGTAVRPLGGNEYDLDLSCKLRKTIARSTHSQEQLANIVGAELDRYRSARRILEKLEPKNRCWRLNYQDQLKFHMDVVPGIPVDTGWRSELSALMENRGLSRPLANRIAEEAAWITDRRNSKFKVVDPDWHISNPEGYIRWFVFKMEDSAFALTLEARIDELPLYQRKTPLQRVIQLLKRHRDFMYAKNMDSQPISIIITTLAADAYKTGESISETLVRVLAALVAFRDSDSNDVPNPVNPRENFADKWRDRANSHLLLKENFHAWVTQVAADFDYLLSHDDSTLLAEHVGRRFGARVSKDRFQAAIGGGASASAITRTPRRQVDITAPPPKPWRQ